MTAMNVVNSPASPTTEDGRSRYSATKCARDAAPPSAMPTGNPQKKEPRQWNNSTSPNNVSRASPASPWPRPEPQHPPPPAPPARHAARSLAAPGTKGGVAITRPQTPYPKPADDTPSPAGSAFKPANLRAHAPRPLPSARVSFTGVLRRKSFRAARTLSPRGRDPPHKAVDRNAIMRDTTRCHSLRGTPKRCRAQSSFPRKTQGQFDDAFSVVPRHRGAPP